MTTTTLTAEELRIARLHAQHALNGLVAEYNDWIRLCGVYATKAEQQRAAGEDAAFAAKASETYAHMAEAAKAKALEHARRHGLEVELG